MWLLGREKSVDVAVGKGKKYDCGCWEGKRVIVATGKGKECSCGCWEGKRV